MRSQRVRMIGAALLVVLLHSSRSAMGFSTTQKTTKRALKCQRKSSFPPTLPVICRVQFSAALETDAVSIPPAPRLVVLLPAYNEAERIGETLDSYHSYLNTSNEWKEKSNILVVDDGSDDGTAGFVRSWTKQVDDSVGIDCISLPTNQGKGAAVSFGIHHLVESFGDEPCLVLIADADGSGDISCLDDMVNVLGSLIASSDARQSHISNEPFWNTPALINGYRGYEGSSLSRSILRWGFRTTVRVLCGNLRVRDSQCGFKLMTLTAARQLYANLNLKRWSHDVEVLYRAREWNMPIAEVAVPWQDKYGSKLVESSAGTVQASASMFLDVLQMRLEYTMGRWKVPNENDRDR